MIAGDLDLDRVVWDAEYRRQVIDFLNGLQVSDGDRTEPAVIPYGGHDRGPWHRPDRAA